jgi:hypothetical protein
LTLFLTLVLTLLVMLFPMFITLFWEGSFTQPPEFPSGAQPQLGLGYRSLH